MTRAANLVLVEGSDDLHFILHVLYRHGFQRTDLFPQERWAVVRSETGDRVEFKPKDGFKKLAADLHVEITPTHLKRVAVIADSDADPALNWQPIRAALQRAGLGTPLDLDRDGAVITNQEFPTIGVWLMPDNRRPGYLEHLVADMIAPDDKLWPYALTCVRSLDEIDRRFTPVRARKAEVHTWLAWQEYPGTRLSDAVVRQYIDANCTAAISFVNWFHRWLDT